MAYIIPFLNKHTVSNINRNNPERNITDFIRFCGTRPDTLQSFLWQVLRTALVAASLRAASLPSASPWTAARPARYESRFGRSAAPRDGRVLERRDSMKRINKLFSRDFWGEIWIIGDIVTIKPDARFKKGFRLFIFVYLLAFYVIAAYSFFYISHHRAQFVSFSFMYWGVEIFIFALMCQQKESS